MFRRTILPAIAASLVLSAAFPAAAAQFRVMIVTWRGCEEACEGVRAELGRSGLDLEIVLRDAAGDAARARGFLPEARAEKVDLVVTWGTSATLAIAGTLEDRGNPGFNHDIPQVFMIVADPVGARLIESLERPGRRNLTGTFNRVPEAVNIDAIRAYVPGFRKLGLLYHRDEANSELKRVEMAALAGTHGFELVALELPRAANGRPRPEDIPGRVRDLREAGADFVYLGSSSFLRAHGGVLARAAREARLPLLSPYEELVRGDAALVSVAARYHDVGRLAGRQAVRMLTQPVPAAGLPVAEVTEFAVVINLDTARAIGMFPPIGLLQIAETVN